MDASVGLLEAGLGYKFAGLEKELLLVCVSRWFLCLITTFFSELQMAP